VLNLVRAQGAQEFADGRTTFRTGLHATVFTAKVRPGVGVQNHLDLVATNRWATAGPDPAAAWRRTVERTLDAALLEADLLPVSTPRLLEGLPLVRASPLWPGDALAGAPLELRDQWNALSQLLGSGYSMLVPLGGTPLACWAVHEPTGTTVGILQDGSGGSAGECAEADHPNDNLLAWAIGRGFEPMLGPAFGVWLELEKAKARIVRRATIMIATGRDPGSLGDIARDLACDIAAQALVPRFAGSDAANVLADLEAVQHFASLFGAGLLTPGALFCKGVDNMNVRERCL
jgi:hypothetical protein